MWITSVGNHGASGGISERRRFSLVLPSWIQYTYVPYIAAALLALIIFLYKCTWWWRHQMEAFFALLAICAGNSPVTGEFPHKGQWHGALMFPLIYAWINGWINNREAGDLRHHRTHYDITAMCSTAMMHINLPRFLALSRQLFLYVWCIYSN